MGEAAPYPFERWARIGRAEARFVSQLARVLGALDAAAITDARTVLGALVTVRNLGTEIHLAETIATNVGASLGLVMTLGSQRAVLALAPGIARVIADRVVGGTGTDVALGPTPLSRGEGGLVGYVVARAMAKAGAASSLVDVGLARDLITGTDRTIAISFELTIGEQRGTGVLAVPLRAIEDVPARPRPLDLSLPVRASIVIGHAVLPLHEIRSLAVGDIIVPDSLTLDPRVADVGRACLVIARSSRAFELELEGHMWRVVRPISLSAPRAPSRWKYRKDLSMTEPSNDTVQSLADVEVELSIELARLEMPIAEVAALAPGVVVTTGRLVGERVAVRAGDRVIAWGELVDVEGEVGVRLTEVAASAT